MTDTSKCRKRALLITRNLPPLRGGMERLNQQLAIVLAEEFDLVLIGPLGCAEHLPERISVHEVPIAHLSIFLFRALQIAWHLSSQPFDVVIAGSGLTAPAVVVAAHRAGAKSVAYVHGLDIVASHPIYRAIWRPFLRRLDAALANSTNTANLAITAGVAHGNVAVLHPGTALPDEISPGDFRDRFGLGAGPLLLSVGRLTQRKGLAEFITHALPAIISVYPDTKLILIGDEAPNALRKTSTDPAQKLLASIRSSGMESHVIRLGVCNDITLSQAYAAADVHVFPVLHIPDDVEGFGMVAIEAAAHGLPTVSFDVGGVTDAVCDHVSGYVVKQGDYKALSAAVCRCLLDEPSPDRVREFASSFAWSNFAGSLYARLRHVMDGAAF
ncbi:glycosyltransferase family 4 protein [Pseudoxanthomonas sp. USHLN014]|uniref:glycosyltransferase family 4 protein n=1 Tax=Pseudoxanthomonas sp. USHLN014 TaxID=3081297 RepID=UPI00301D60C7